MNEKNNLIKASFKIIEEIGWNKFSLILLSKNNGISINKVKFYFRRKLDVLISFSKMIDEEIISEINLQEFEENSVKDNLFELIMLRFEKLRPYKKCLIILIDELKTKPIILKKIMLTILDSFKIFLLVSKAKENFIIDFFKIHIIFLIYTFIFRIWLKDDSEDMNKTMVELDKRLSQVEQLYKKFFYS